MQPILLEPKITHCKYGIKKHYQQHSRKHFPNEIYWGWVKSQDNPADIASKITFDIVPKLNSNIYREGPISYLTNRPWSHLFMSIKRDGTEVFTPPVNTEGLNMCLTCTAPENCGLAMAMANTKRKIRLDDELYP